MFRTELEEVEEGEDEGYQTNMQLPTGRSDIELEDNRKDGKYLSRMQDPVAMGGQRPGERLKQEDRLKKTPPAQTSSKKPEYLGGFFNKLFATDVNDTRSWEELLDVFDERNEFTGNQEKALAVHLEGLYHRCRRTSVLNSWYSK